MVGDCLIMRARHFRWRESQIRLSDKYVVTWTLKGEGRLLQVHRRLCRDRYAGLPTKAEKVFDLSMVQIDQQVVDTCNDLPCPREGTNS